ncbi:MAG: molybdopterin molybdotransferase MoeA [Omnitrophica bacterium]|nr:molybdopterin molybdotransferase MoeA [Candidatus Omnitrophota bacterium]
MIRVKQALTIILKSIRPLGREQVDLSNGLDRIISFDVRAKCKLPPFDNSAMDGYALRAKDTKGASKVEPRVLQVIEDVPAGYTAKNKIRDNQAIRIMTGAAFPSGADSVVMVEFTKRVKRNKKSYPEEVEIYKETKLSENVRRAGEDVKKGQRVLSRGCILRPQELGMLAALGINRIDVAKRPRVGILATGDELVPVQGKLGKGKIRNSNSFILRAQISKCGGIPIDLGIARDKRRELRSKITTGLKKKLDLLLVLGGISVGDYDLVKDVLFELGMKMKFWRVAMRPGKPLAFGFIKGIPVFGLPGNPVSSTISFEEFVRPALLKMQGAKNLFRPRVWATLTEDLQKKKNLRYFIRAKVKIKNGKFYVSSTGAQGSGIINSLVLADGIIVAPEGLELLKQGQMISVQLLRQGYDGGVI